MSLSPGIYWNHFYLCVGLKGTEKTSFSFWQLSWFLSRVALRSLLLWIYILPPSFHLIFNTGLQVHLLLMLLPPTHSSIIFLAPYICSSHMNKKKPFNCNSSFGQFSIKCRNHFLLQLTLRHLYISNDLFCIVAVITSLLPNTHNPFITAPATCINLCIQITSTLSMPRYAHGTFRYPACKNVCIVKTIMQIHL